MKIILHIGTEKTGTTSIQGFLSDNRDELRKHKIMYSKVLGDPNNIRLSIALQNVDKIDDSRIHAKVTNKEEILEFRNNLKENLKNEIVSENPDILIISSEHLSSRMNKEEEIERLKIFLNEFSDDITVIVYLRRQDKFFESLYSTAIKKGHVMNFSFPPAGQERRDFHYSSMLELWEKSFDPENIKVKVFDKSRFFQKDVISDFIHTLNLPIKYEKSKEKRENLSFGRKKLSFLKEFNNYIPEIINHHSNPVRGNIERLLENIDIDDESIQMASGDSSEFLERFLEGNKEISKRYFDSKDVFNLSLSEKKEKIDLDISSKEAIEIISKIWSKKQKECNDKLFIIKTLEVEVELVKGHIEKALLLSEFLWSQYPNHPRTNYLYAYALFNNSEINEAKRYCEKAIKLNSKNKEFVQLLSLITEGKNK